MPDVTPIYNWPIPEDTDLVKDGAKAIRDLAGAVETTVDSGGDSGLVHIKTRTLTATSLESFNNVFTSDFTHYRLAITGKLASGADFLDLRLRVAGSDNSTSNYFFQELRGAGSSATAGRSSNDTKMALGLFSTTEASAFVDVSTPQLATDTNYFVGNSFFGSDIFLFSGAFRASTQFDGFSVLPRSSTFTGTLSIYGYAKA